jgi:8-oxo-dGTP diphosphatase
MHMTDQVKPKKIGVGFGVMLKRGNQILLGKRNDDPEKASSEMHGEGTWTMPGGKFEHGESFIEGAKREALEETGIVLNNVEVICVNNDINGDAHFVTIGMYCEDFSGEAQTMEPEEITEWKWFDIDALPEKVFPPSKKLLNNYLQKKFYLEDNQ